MPPQVWFRESWEPSVAVCTHDTNVLIHRGYPIYKSPTTGRYFLYDAAHNVSTGLSQESDYTPTVPVQVGDPKWPSWRVNQTRQC